MIYDKLAHLPRYAPLSDAFAAAAAWVADTDLAALAFDSKKFAIDGDRVFAIPQAYELFTPKQQILESHRRYHDIQIVVEGEEAMRVLPLDAGIAETQPYDPDKDATFYDPAEAGAKRPGVDLPLYPGVFVVLTPDDIHGPNRRPGSHPGYRAKPTGNNRKVVVKVAVDG